MTALLVVGVLFVLAVGWWWPWLDRLADDVADRWASPAVDYDAFYEGDLTWDDLADEPIFRALAQERLRDELADEAIRRRYTGGHGEQSALAREFGVTQALVHMIVKGCHRA